MAPQSMGWQTVWLILKLMMLVALSTAAASDSPPCQTAIVSASDDGKWLVGGRGRVSCACDGSSDVHNLNWFLGGKKLATEIVNNTVWHTEPFATESVQNEYECWWKKDHPIKSGSAKVTVFAVLNVTDFVCRFDVEEQLNCSFSRADGEDFHKTTSYKLRASGGESRTATNCTAEQGNPGRVHCMVNMTSFAHASERQHFTLTMMSNLTRPGRTQTQELELLNENMYVPKWPSRELSRTTVTNNKTCLVWDLVNDLLEKTLEWVVELRPRRPEIPPLNLTLPGGTQTDLLKLKFCFPHPPQGFQVFDVRLKCHIAGNNTIWSEYYPEFAITTNATVPARPPEFIPNGFSFDNDKKELTVLWFPLDLIDINGPNLTYEVYRNGYEKDSPNHTYGRSAIFTDWDDSQPANVTVRSRNSVGASVESRSLSVPAISEVAKRRATQLKYHSHTLYWEKPEDSDLLVGYNIYWCNASSETFCQDVGSTNSISLDDRKLQEYKFNSTMVDQNIALEPIYKDNISGGMTILLTVSDDEYRPFVLQKVQILEGIGALMVLGLVILSVRKLQKMNDLDIDISFITNLYNEQSRAEPKSESEFAPRMGVPKGYYDVRIEFQTFTEEQPEREKEEEKVVVQTEPKSQEYVPMNPIGINGDIRPPSPRINPNGNGYVMGPPPRLTPNVEAYINPPPPPPPPPQPRLNPNNEGYINPPQPRLSPNNEGYINPNPPSPRINPNSNGYVTAPPPRSIPNPNNNGYVDPPLPRLLPNSDGYINPNPPRLNPDGNPIGRNGNIRPPSPRINPNSNGYVTAPPPRSIPNPNNNGYVDPPLPRLLPNSDGYINPSPPQR